MWVAILLNSFVPGFMQKFVESLHEYKCVPVIQLSLHGKLCTQYDTLTRVRLSAKYVHRRLNNIILHSEKYHKSVVCTYTRANAATDE